MTYHTGDRPSDADANMRTNVIRVSALVVALGAVCGLLGWHYYGNASSPHPTVVGDPTRKIGPADGVSKNAATIDNLDKPATSRNE
jgi:hypothetical protein